MSFFSRTPRTSDVFVVQDQTHLGSLHARSSFEDLGLSIGEEAMPVLLHGHRFIGTTISKKRIWIGFLCAALVLLIFLTRAFDLQIRQRDHYLALAESNRFRTHRIIPPRGIITDRNGVILARNIPSFVLTMTIADLPIAEDARRTIFDRVSSLAGIQPTEIDLALTEFANAPFEEIPIQRNIPYEAAIRLAIDLSSLPGFDLQSSSQRAYHAGVLSLSHLLGYTGRISAQELSDLNTSYRYRPIDSIGKIGIEKTAEPLLRGVPGEEVYEVDARGNNLSIVSKTEAKEGESLAITIDLAFQKYAEERLLDTLDAVGATKGTVVALNPQNGAVRALVSLPSYDNNQFAQGIDAKTYEALLNDVDHPLFHRAISGEYPSGSTLKPVMAYAALAEGVVSEHTSFVSSGGIRINEWFFPDWKAGGHGTTDVRKAIAESVNTFFYIIGGGYQETVGLGVDRMTQYARRFGFGNKTGIELSGEADGFLPSKEWKLETKGERWYIGDTYHLAIGQGDFLTTPLQLAVAIGTIANRGIRMQPTLIESVNGVMTNVNVTSPLGPIESLDEYALSLVRQGMRQTVVQGSARSLSTLSEQVAGKTGTAQSTNNRPYHSWFAGFAPYDQPTIALVVLIEEGGESNAAAVPLARDLFSWWFALGND